MYERSTHKPPASNRPEPHRHLGRFPRHAVSVKEVRDWLRRRMNLRPTSARIPESVTEDALLITSEITTNALLHSPSSGQRGAFVVSAFFYTHCMRVSIRGGSTTRTRTPHLRVLPATPDAEHGRGLFIVNVLASTWGSEHTRNGSAVFFTLDWEAPDPLPSPGSFAALTSPSPGRG